MEDTPYYLKIERSADLKDKKERIFYRFLEIVPGALSWLTLILSVVLSWLKPVWAAYFIICFVTYWLFRTIYFSFHLQACYKQMRLNEKTDWLAKIKDLPGANDVWNLAVLPMYREPLQVVREAFDSLVKSDWPKEKMLVVLSCEEKGDRETAEKIKEEYQNEFFRFSLTFHPFGLPGEMVGKGSNENWAERQAKTIIDELKIPYQNVILSALDADTVVFPKYFSCLAYYYLTSENPARTSFQPVPLFVNNIWQSPPISRIFSFSATFWQMMCQERPEVLLTFSSHAMSFQAAYDVGFRQANVVSDDSRIFWQCFLRYRGDYKVQPLYYPISMDANVAPTFLQTMKNIYLQQRRWAYGVGEIPYFLFGFHKDRRRYLLSGKKGESIPLSKKISLGLTIFEGHWSWATNSIVVFLLGWLPLILGGDVFSKTLLSYNLPILTSRVLTLGMLGLIGSAYLSIMLLPERPPDYGKKRYALFALEWVLLPLIMVFFTSFPALEAQTRWMVGKYLGFWPTPKIRK